MAKVLILGASKGIGSATVRKALDSGFRVRAFARSTHLIRIDDERLEKRRGDALNPLDVENALDGIDVVVQTLGIPTDFGMVLRPVTLFSKATSILVPAMEAKGIRRLITVTGFGAGDSRASIARLQRLPFRLVFGHAYDDKDVQEQIIRDSHLDWTIVRPGVLTNRSNGNGYKVLLSASEWRNGIISRRDVADFLVRTISDNSYIRTTPVLTS